VGDFFRKLAARGAEEGDVYDGVSLRAGDPVF